MTGLLSDLRFGFRSLVANPTFVVLAVLCLGIGIGASAMTFTAINAALLDPLGPIDPKGIVSIAESHRSAPDAWQWASLPNLRDWQTALAERAQIGALRPAGLMIGPSEADVRVEGAHVTDNLFAILRVAPILGRGFEARDAAADSEPVVLLNEGYWRRQFGGDAAIIGTVLRVDGTPRTVVGVMPDLLAVGIPTVIRSARVWVPIRADSQNLARDDRSWVALARFSADVSVESFTAQLGIWHSRRPRRCTVAACCTASR
jgi:putative ABC transport system permease protein